MSASKPQPSKIEKDPARNDARKDARRRRFPEGAVCAMCGESDPITLENHHPTGRNVLDDLTVVLCRSCHAKASEGQRDAGLELESRPNDSIIDTAARVLEAIAAFFITLAYAFLALSERLVEGIARLNDANPDWRQALAEV